MTPHDQVPWGDDTFAVYKADRETGIGMSGELYDLAYDDSTPNPDGSVCNALCTDGSVCRLPRAHFDELNGMPHMRFDPNLVVTSGMYVLAIHPAGTVTT